MTGGARYIPVLPPTVFGSLSSLPPLLCDAWYRYHLPSLQVTIKTNLLAELVPGMVPVAPGVLYQVPPGTCTRCLAGTSGNSR